MKAFVVLLALLALVWLLTGSRRRPPGPGAGASAPPPAPPAPAAPKPAMQACAQCGVYLPHDEALPGRGGAFCSAEHRAAHERAHGT